MRHAAEWLLLGLLVVSVLGNCQRGREVRRLCELLEGAVLVPVQGLPARQEIATICAGRHRGLD